MATQPNIEDFASLLNIPSARRVARNMADTSSAPQFDHFGARPGRPIATPKARRLAAEAVSANAIIHARLLAARDEVVGDPDYATLQQRWDDAARRILDEGLDRISHRGLRDRVQTDLLPTLTAERAAIADQASRSAVQQHAANRDTMLRNLLQRQRLDPNDALLGGGTDAYHAMIDDAVGRGHLSADEALAEKRRGALALCESEYAAMPRRDPDRAIRELRGEANNHPLLAYLPQERKDTLIRQAQLRQAANAMDAELADMRRQQQERRGADEAESAIVADLFGDSPSVTANAILDNTALSEDARQRMLGAVARQNQPEPDAQVSQATTLDLLDRIRRPDGDAEKITGIGPLVDAYNRGELSRADFRFAAKQLADAGTPEGELFARHRQAYIKAMAAQVEPAPLDSPQGGEAGARPDVDSAEQPNDSAAEPDDRQDRAVALGAVKGVADEAIGADTTPAETTARVEGAEEQALAADALADSLQESAHAERGAPEGDINEAADGRGKPGEAVTDDSQSNEPAASIAQTLDQVQTSANTARSWLYNLERDIDYRIDRYRRDGKDPLDLFDPSKPDYVGKSATMSLPVNYSSLSSGLTRLAQNAPTPSTAQWDPRSRQ